MLYGFEGLKARLEINPLLSFEHRLSKLAGAFVWGCIRILRLLNRVIAEISTLSKRMITYRPFGPSLGKRKHKAEVPFKALDVLGCVRKWKAKLSGHRKLS